MRVPGLCVAPAGSAFPYDWHVAAGERVNMDEERRMAAVCSSGSPDFNSDRCYHLLGIAGAAAYTIAYWEHVSLPVPVRPSLLRRAYAFAAGQLVWAVWLVKTALLVAGAAACLVAVASKAMGSGSPGHPHSDYEDGGGGGGGGQSGSRRRRRVVFGEDQEQHQQQLLPGHQMQ